MTSSADIRRAFLDFFQTNDHTIIASSPLVPRNDPTLLFANSGMVQFKNAFTGVETRPYQRATTAQKCLRAGGKHNDLENVGYTARHQTFFEMLGNFSFGDYFKDTAIDLAWTLITREFGLPADRLMVTIYADDDEAYTAWRRISGLPDERIIRIGTSDNFWRMGDTGPCGPCSEIFYDHGPAVAGGPPGSPDADGDRFVEIWNLVFMQFEQRADGTMVPLPRPSIDTGMGLERLAAVLQGRHDNFDTDILRALILASADATGTKPDGASAVSHRIIADHIRASGFLVADGVLPSNEGRGYVLRRIMRRAMRHVHILGAREPVLHRLVPFLIREMASAYPELERAAALLTGTLRLEEERFRQLLDRGLRLLDEEVARLGDEQPLPGRVAFTLYDTFGFPLDLTQDVLRGQGRIVAQEEFDTAMAEQRRKARAAWVGSGEAAADGLWLDLREELGSTEFLGHATLAAEGVVLAIIRDGRRVDVANAGDSIAIVTNQTPYYAESGGQVGDHGTASSANGAQLTISDTVKRAGILHVHMGQLEYGRLVVGDALVLRVDRAQRDAISAGHSATHLLHAALRQRLGLHVTQKGSLVSKDRLRFDISHPVPLTGEEVLAVEAEVNARIRANSRVTTQLMAAEQAITTGAMALFGEKYGAEVRVVSMGGRDEEGARDFSVELCGGTHVRRTGDIGFFKIINEAAVAAGVRRVDAVVGKPALDYLNRQLTLVEQSAAALRVAPGDLPGRVAALAEDRRRMERELTELRRKLALQGDRTAVATGESAKDVRVVNGIKLAVRVVALAPRELKPLVDALKNQLGSGGVVIAVSTAEGRASLVVGVTDDLVGRFSAVDLVRAGALALGGSGGGGRPDMAQAGGPDAERTGDAILKIEGLLAGAAV